MNDLVIIGDIHGRLEEYKSACRLAKYSFQVGDLIRHPSVMVADNETFEELNPYTYRFYETSKLDPNYHKFIGGNHDNYDLIDKCPYSLGKYGVWNVPNVGDIFFVRGGFSIDWKYGDRNEILKHTVTDGVNFYKPRNLWRDLEELTHNELNEAIEFYKNLDPKPEMIISHEAPLFFLDRVTSPDFVKQFGYSNPIIRTKTNQALNALYDIHAPKYHFFGHYHFDYVEVVNSTTLVCLGLGSYASFSDGKLSFFGGNFDNSKRS